MERSKMFLSKNAKDIHKILPDLVWTSTKVEIISTKIRVKRYKKGNRPHIVPEYMFKKNP